jgi:hypothetical protein
MAAGRAMGRLRHPEAFGEQSGDSAGTRPSITSA